MWCKIAWKFVAFAAAIAAKFNNIRQKRKIAGKIVAISFVRCHRHGDNISVKYIVCSTFNFCVLATKC